MRMLSAPGNMPGSVYEASRRGTLQPGISVLFIEASK